MTRIVEIPVRTVATCPECNSEARIGKHDGQFVLAKDSGKGIAPCSHALSAHISDGRLVVSFCIEDPTE